MGEHGRKERASQSEEQSVTVGASGLVLGPCGASAVIRGVGVCRKEEDS